MTKFRYQAIEGNGSAVKGVIEAEDRKAALQLLGERGLFPSILEVSTGNGNGVPAVLLASSPPIGERVSEGRAKGISEALPLPRSAFRIGARVKRKEITAFTREMAALLGAGISILQALSGLGEEEANPAFKEVVLKVADSVRKGSAVSAALEEHPKLFNKLYVSM